MMVTLDDLKPKSAVVKNQVTGQELTISELTLEDIHLALTAMETKDINAIYKVYVEIPLRKAFGEKEFDEWKKTNEISLSWALPVFIESVKLLGAMEGDAEKKAQTVISAMQKSRQKKQNGSKKT